MVHAHRLADELPRATRHEVPDAGHFLFVTHATEVFGGLLEDAGA
jgi:pimeloyl-ACP methyl ester carboxylesterase